ncbi:MAG TPA: hypothetical protein VHL78_06080 [Actinomycetota bacterium]|nr:hypothetical protein [Actinomycetota bacterium]
MRKAISPALFAVVVICFFLPFFTVACSAGDLGQLGEQLGGDFELPASEELEQTVTGWDLVIGNTEEAAAEATDETPAQTEAEADGRPDVYAVVAFAAAVLGIGLSFLRRPLGPILAVGLGLLGAIFLFLLRSRLTGQIPAQARAFIEVRTEYGFWLALLFFLAAAGWGVYRLVAPREPAAAAPTGFEAGAPSLPPEPPPP